MAIWRLEWLLAITASMSTNGILRLLKMVPLVTENWWKQALFRHLNLRRVGMA